jgi:hypothetical protein
MQTSNGTSLPPPPSLVRSLSAGFDTVSNHIGLILFGVVLDLLLWLGPQARVAVLLKPVFEQAAALPEMQAQQEAFHQLMDGLQNLNLLSFLRTLPVGVPSLLASQLVGGNPLGEWSVWELGSIQAAAVLWLAMVLLGCLAGTVYFSAVSQAALQERLSWEPTLRRSLWAFGQVLLLLIFWLALILALFFPISCVMSLFLMGGLGAGQVSIVVLLMMSGVMIWLLLPLVFIPHGIFVLQRSLWESIRVSVRLTRWTLPSTMLFILSVVLLSQGLDLVWTIPQSSSWLALVGILGHAFVATSLLAASFVYYQEAHTWMQETLQKVRLSSVK